MSEWIVPGNPKLYDLVGAFKELGKVNWKQSTNVEVGDVVYIYASGEQQRILFKCKVNKVNLGTAEIDDSKFNISGEFDGLYGRYMEIEAIENYNTSLFSRSNLEKYGFPSLRGPVRVPFAVKEYIDVVQKLLSSEEMDPYSHDGSYELVRETIRAYKI